MGKSHKVQLHIKAVGFDYGGVLAGWPSSRFDQEFCKLLDISLETFHDHYFQINYLLNKGTLPKEEFFKRLLQSIGKESEFDKVLEFLHSVPEKKIDENVLALVDRLRTQQYKVGILSNNTLAMAEEIRNSGLGDHFDVVSISAEVGMLKPDPEFFRLFFKKLGVDPKEGIFIDDTAKNFIHAGEVGFHPILFKSYEELLVALRQFNIKGI